MSWFFLSTTKLVSLCFVHCLNLSLCLPNTNQACQLSKPHFQQDYPSINRLMMFSVPQTCERFIKWKLRSCFGKPLPGPTALRPASGDRYQSQHVSATGTRRCVCAWVCVSPNVCVSRLQRIPIPFDLLMYAYMCVCMHVSGHYCDLPNSKLLNIVSSLDFWPLNYLSLYPTPF